MNRSWRLPPAVVAVLLLVAGCGSGGRTAADLPAPSSPATDAGSTPSGAAPSASTTTVVEQTGPDVPVVVVDTRGEAHGAAPRTAYLFAAHPEFLEGDWRLLRPDGTSTRLPRVSFAEVALMGRGLVGLFGSEAGVTVWQVDADGRPTRHWNADSRRAGLAVTPDRSVVGWLGRDGAPHVAEGGGRRHLRLPTVPLGVDLGALWGEGTCREQEPEGGGCTAFVNVTGGRVRVSTSHGIVDLAGPMQRVTDVSADGRVVGLVSQGGGRACWGLWGRDGRLAWRTCERRLDAFSPDGRRVLSLAPARREPWRSHTLALLDRSGRTLATFRVAGRHAAIGNAVWEDRAHVLASVFAHGRWAVLRLGIDGSHRLAAGPVRGEVDLRPYLLPLR